MWKVCEVLPAEQVAAMFKLREQLANAALRGKLAEAQRDREARTVG